MRTLVIWLGRPGAQAHLVVERADGAVGHALAAALAARIQQELVGAGHQLALEARVGRCSRHPGSGSRRKPARSECRGCTYCGR